MAKKNETYSSNGPVMSRDEFDVYDSVCLVIAEMDVRHMLDDAIENGTLMRDVSDAEIAQIAVEHKENVSWSGVERAGAMLAETLFKLGITSA